MPCGEGFLFAAVCSDCPPSAERRAKNPMIKGDYQQALGKLASARKKLDTIEDPAEAREVVDEMSRLVLDVRRALWELEKKAKEKRRLDASKQRSDAASVEKKR